MIKRTDIIFQAKTWIGTNFRYQGRIKKNNLNNGGVDCLGLIFGVCDEVGYTYKEKPLSYYDNIVYSKKPNFEILKEKFSLFFNIKDKKFLDIGDIILKQISKEQYHLMFYNCNTVIHASATAHKVVEHINDNLDNIIIYSLFK